MKLTTFFISAAWQVLTKLLAVYESPIKLKVRLHWALLVTLLISAVICKQRLLYGNEIVQYLQNSKCYKISKDHFRKTL